MRNVVSTRLSGSLSSALQAPCTEPELYWLGQAGFLIRSPGLTWVVDPYLSDRLADKYRNHEFSHERRMPAPLSAAELPELDFVFCTHHHGDHLDGPSLEWIAANRSHTRFVVPAGIAAEMSRLALPAERVLWAEAAGLQRSYRLKASQDADDTVIFARIGNRVDVRAGTDDRSLRIGPIPTRESVPNRVLAYRKPGGPAPFDHPRAGAHVRWCEKNPRYDGRLRFRNGSELFDLRV